MTISPLPWHTFEFDDVNGVSCEQYDIAHCGPFNSSGSREDSEWRDNERANAAFIVTAVNAHDALVAYAECEESYSDGYGDIWEEVFTKHGWDRTQTAVVSFLHCLRLHALQLAKGA